MRDARLNTGQRAKQVATLETNYARAITRVDLHHQLLHSTNNATVGLACAAVHAIKMHAIKTVHKSILVDLDFVRALATLDCANASILANIFKKFLV
ncbi:hypothetical protein F2Q69_00048108 [Brassica cretica]|uniref:Uncharacterized protein n=1 Tax=Brassica cretica TaxID=69181 RepID=A0A8S9Q7S4_BRACR|nr:hypothetical protein F2Q69_00048108 [Brassica cretica]